MKKILVLSSVVLFVFVSCNWANFVNINGTYERTDGMFRLKITREEGNTFRAEMFINSYGTFNKIGIMVGDIEDDDANFKTILRIRKYFDNYGNIGALAAHQIHYLTVLDNGNTLQGNKTFRKLY